MSLLLGRWSRAREASCVVRGGPCSFGGAGKAPSEASLAGRSDASLPAFTGASGLGAVHAVSHAVGALYDPLLFESEDFDVKKTPFKKPNPAQALDWYRKALALGEIRAKARSEVLEKRLQDSAPVTAAKPERIRMRCEPIPSRRYGPG